MSWEHVSEPTKRVIEKLADAYDVERLERENDMQRVVIAEQAKTIERLQGEVRRLSKQQGGI